MKKSPKAIRTLLTLSLLTSCVSPIFAMQTADDKELANLQIPSHKVETPSFLDKAKAVAANTWDKAKDAAEDAKDFVTDTWNDGNLGKAKVIGSGVAVAGLTGLAAKKLFFESNSRILNKIVKELQEKNAYITAVRQLIENKKISKKDKVLQLIANKGVVQIIGAEKLKAILGKECTQFIKDANKEGIVTRVAKAVWSNKFKLGTLAAVGGYFLFPEQYTAAAIAVTDGAKYVWNNPKKVFFNTASYCSAALPVIHMGQIANTKVVTPAINALIEDKSTSKNHGQQKQTPQTKAEIVEEAIKSAKAGKFVAITFASNQSVKALNTLLKKIADKKTKVTRAITKRIETLKANVLAEKKKTTGKTVIRKRKRLACLASKSPSKKRGCNNCH